MRGFRSATERPSTVIRPSYRGTAPRTALSNVVLPEPRGAWIQAGRLPRAMGYGMSVTYDGSGNATGTFANYMAQVTSLGLAGASDMRDIQAGVDRGDETATRAFEVYIHRLRAYAGAYLAQLGGVDVIVFTAGVGENAPAVREQALATLGFAGVRIDPERNAAPARGIRTISADDSAVTVLVVPTDEELEIARQSLEVARG